MLMWPGRMINCSTVAGPPTDTLALAIGYLARLDDLSLLRGLLGVTFFFTPKMSKRFSLFNVTPGLRAFIAGELNEQLTHSDRDDEAAQRWS